MTIIPAIDIINGKCVRLTQGNYDQEKVYGDDPVIVAKNFQAAGAKLIHIVDLDGAKSGSLQNLFVIKKIKKAVSIDIELGGGIRTIETVRQLLSIPVKHIVIGTIALEDTNTFQKILNVTNNSITVGLDAKNGQLVTKGWLTQTNKNVIETAKQLESMGATRFIYTDIERDGMLTSPNFDSFEKLRKSIKSELIASGGVSQISDITTLKELGADGVIIGKALYEGKISLQEALDVS